ncbi:hypothetical protein [Clostridium oceanicum]|uniref:Histidine kinase N-terminal 7TM region domain-containing protein n=1 Tax=Clostridium oceanicum TaxID=1543 RepID=A0ABN1JQE6_9CLOT
MFDIFAIIFCLLLIFLLLIKGLIKTLYCPKKIKAILLFVFLTLILRYVSISFLMFSTNIKNLYLLKYFYFMNSISIPIAGLICIYISVRNNKLNLSYTYFVMLVLTVLYLVITVKYPTLINVYNNKLYTMNLCTPIDIDIYYILLNLLFLVVSFRILKRNLVNFNVISMVIISSIVGIIQSILNIGDYSIIPYNMICDLFWVYTTYYYLKKVEKH